MRRETSRRPARSRFVKHDQSFQRVLVSCQACTSACAQVGCRKRHGEVLCFSYEQQKRGSGVFHYFLLLHSSVGFRSCSRAGLIVLHRLVEREGKLSSRQQSVFVGVFVPPSSVLHISQPCEQQKEQKELCAPAPSFPLVPSSHLLSPSPHSLSLSFSSFPPEQ